jgi:dATP pyrophosphohydrolase
MERLPLQVLVLPFRRFADGTTEYAVLRRRDHTDDCWQGVAGGAEQGESAEQAARREMMEEAGIPVDAPLVQLDAVASVPASQFQERDLWGPDVYVVTERAFGVYVDDNQAITLSDEHTEYRWVPYEEAARLLRWDSNRTALWELNERLRRSDMQYPFRVPDGPLTEADHKKAAQDGGFTGKYHRGG